MFTKKLQVRNHVEVARAIGVVVRERVRPPMLHPHVIPLVFESLKVGIRTGRLPEVNNALSDRVPRYGRKGLRQRG